MESNTLRDSCGQCDIKNLNSIRNIINSLKLRCSGSISVAVKQTNTGEGKENLPQERKTLKISKEPEKGSGICNKSVTLQVSPQAGLGANPKHNQKHPSQTAGEGYMRKHKPLTASSPFHPVFMKSDNQEAPEAVLGRIRGHERKQERTNTPLEHNIATKGHNSGSPHNGKVSYGTQIPSRTSVYTLNSKSLPLNSGTKMSTSSKCQSDVSHLLKKLQSHNTVKRVYEGSLGDQDVQQSMDHSIPQNQNPDLPYNLKSTPQRQQPKRQCTRKPLSIRKVIRITLPKDIQAQRICFVLSEVAKAFHCSVSIGEAVQDFSESRGIGNSPVDPYVNYPFLQAPNEAFSWCHAYAHNYQREGRSPSKRTQNCE